MKTLILCNLVKNRVAIVAFALIAVFLSSASNASLVITEILINPDAVPDNQGEWFEIYNASVDIVSLENWSVGDNDTDSFVIAGSLVIAPNEHLVFGNNSNVAANGGVDIDYDYSGSMVLSNSGDEIILYDEIGTEIDRVEWGSDFDVQGKSRELMAAYMNTIDNDNPNNWGISTAILAGGDFGTPGAVNFDVSSVPIPPAVWLFGSAIFGLTGIIRRRKLAAY
ncbi:MAG: hypothetical protein GY727_05975 [Gammaproteobacteria bacterium]|nr:hypothetical protein [Gammaproteobacteria bacterium]